MRVAEEQLTLDDRQQYYQALDPSHWPCPSGGCGLASCQSSPDSQTLETHSAEQNLDRTKNDIPVPNKFYNMNLSLH